jgi:hypothetical protein
MLKGLDDDSHVETRSAQHEAVKKKKDSDCQTTHHIKDRRSQSYPEEVWLKDL